ncbi:hypothetical protein BDW68DRAFT_163617, partial [Aspergillus falconensis]
MVHLPLTLTTALAVLALSTPALCQAEPSDGTIAVYLQDDFADYPNVEAVGCLNANGRLTTNNDSCATVHLDSGSLTTSNGNYFRVTRDTREVVIDEPTDQSTWCRETGENDDGIPERFFLCTTHTYDRDQPQIEFESGPEWYMVNAEDSGSRVYGANDGHSDRRTVVGFLYVRG